MYDGAGAQYAGIKFLKPLSPPNLRDPYAAKFYIAGPRTWHKILKFYLKF